MNDAVEFSDMTPDQVAEFTSMIVKAVGRDPAGFLDEPVTPFCTVRDLMYSSPPSRLRWIARRAWLRRLSERVHAEMTRQCAFARAITRAAQRIGGGHL